MAIEVLRSTIFIGGRGMDKKRGAEPVEEE